MFIKKKRALLLGILLLVTFAVLRVIIIGINPKKAELSVETDMGASVYVDEEYVGTGTVEKEVVAKDVILKITPRNSNTTLPFETALSLTPYTKTIVRHKFRDNISSSTQILSFKKSITKSTNITILTNPSDVEVFLAETSLGSTPLTVAKELGEYTLFLKKVGYEDTEVTVKNAPGFELIVWVDLPVVNNEALTHKPTQTLTILSNSEGFVNVHTAASSNSNSIARVLPGREYTVSEFSQNNDWIKIELNASQSGWIKSQYAEVK